MSLEVQSSTEPLLNARSKFAGKEKFNDIDVDDESEFSLSDAEVETLSLYDDEIYKERFPPSSRKDNESDDFFENGGDVVRSKINLLNILNLVAYCFNILVSFGVGCRSCLSILPGTADVTEKYHTLLFPDKHTFKIWLPIFIFEGLFVIAQMGPYRSHSSVQGIKSYFILVCLSQTIATILFSLKYVWFSFLAAFVHMVLLLCLIVSQMQLKNSGSFSESNREYCLMRFPFSLHFGWILPMATILFGASLLDEKTNDSPIQLAVSIVSLIIWVVVAVISLFGPFAPDFVIPVVIVWTMHGVVKELGHPTSHIVEDYGEIVISGVRGAFEISCFFLLLLWIPRISAKLIQQFCTISIVEH